MHTVPIILMEEGAGGFKERKKEEKRTQHNDEI